MVWALLQVTSLLPKIESINNKMDIPYCILVNKAGVVNTGRQVTARSRIRLQWVYLGLIDTLTWRNYFNYGSKY